MKYRLKLSQREAIEGFLYITPWLIGFAVFYAGPLIASLLFSFTSWDLLSPMRWIGSSNYQNMLKDELFFQALKVTTIYSIFAVPLQLTVSLILAMLLNAKIKFISAFRTSYYVPTILPAVVTAILWRWIFNPEIGLINLFLKALGLRGPEWLTSPHWALPALIIMSLWSIGSSIIIFLGGLQGVPDYLYEAAELDGANLWEKFKNVTFPMISPVFFFNLIIGIIDSFQVFTYPYIMTRGGPEYATLFYVLYLYQNAFQYFKMGYASSLAWVLFLIILLLTLLQTLLSKKWVFYFGGEQ